MKTICKYDSDNDKEIYLSELVTLNNYNLNVSACTVSGDSAKLNEDAYSITEANGILRIGVFDGTTSLKNTLYLKDTTGARFSSHFLIKEIENIDPELSSEDNILMLNNRMSNKIQKMGGNPNDTAALPASMAAVAKIDLLKEKLEVSNIGDVYGIVYLKSSKSEIVTTDTNQKFDDKIFSLISNSAMKNKISNRDARMLEEVKDALSDMYYKRNNNPDGKGSGLINGDPNLAKYMHTKIIPLKDIKAVLIASDGLEIQGQSINNDKYRLKIFDYIAEDGFKKLIKLKKKSEDEDPDWNFVRYKHSDDATGVFIEFKRNL